MINPEISASQRSSDTTQRDFSAKGAPSAVKEFLHDPKLLGLKTKEAVDYVDKYTREYPELDKDVVRTVVETVVNYRRQIQELEKHEHKALTKEDWCRKAAVNKKIIETIEKLGQDIDFCKAFWEVLKEINRINDIPLNRFEALKSGMMGELAISQGLKQIYKQEKYNTRWATPEEDMNKIDLFLVKPSGEELNLQVKVNSDSQEPFLNVDDFPEIDGKQISINHNSGNLIFDLDTGLRTDLFNKLLERNKGKIDNKTVGGLQWIEEKSKENERRRKIALEMIKKEKEKKN